MSSIEKALGSLVTPRVGHREVSENKGKADLGREAEPPLADFCPAGVNGRHQTCSTPDMKRRVTIPFAELQAAGYIVPTSPRSTIAEEFRTIKRPLLKNIDGQPEVHIQNANLIMVTSALEGDGKTFSSLNLAMSIAMEQDKTVLFVDADVVKATAGGVLGIDHDTAGLIDVLKCDGVELKDVILRTNVENLSVLPAGIPHERSTELLASKTMHELMMEVSARYHDRVIVFDSPPLLMTSESAVLASFMGQIVFVAAAHVTPQHAVREALQYVSEDKVVAVLLNKVPRSRLRLFGIGQGYGYNYSYGYSDGYADRRERSLQRGPRQ